MVCVCLTRNTVSCLAGAKVQLFRKPAKLFPRKFHFSDGFFDALDVNQITVLEQSINEKCATDSIKTQINVIKSQIKAINGACDTEKAEITAEKNKYKIAFWSLVVIIGLFVSRKIIK